MSSVQDNVIKRMEQNVDQLTIGNILCHRYIIISDVIVYYIAHQLPLPTQTPRTTIVNFLISMILFIIS